MSDTVLRMAQELDPDPVVELWELDTTALTNIYGEQGTGNIYRWTPGVLNYRDDGVLSAGSTATLLVLDKLINLRNSALSYQAQAANTDGSFNPWIAVSGFGTAVVGGNTVTTVGLASAMPYVPQAGAAYLLESHGSVLFGGVEYVPAPIELTGHEWSGQGKLPRPKLRVSNLGGLAAALVIQYGDIVGAQVKRLQTFKSCLDGEPNADSSALFEPDIFVVDRKSAHNKHIIEFELAAGLDQQGIALPKRIVLRNHCDHTYRQWSTVGGGHFVYGTCPYVGGLFFQGDGSATTDPSKDLCGKREHDCLIRFGNSLLPNYGNPLLPIRSFPGVAEVAN